MVRAVPCLPENYSGEIIEISSDDERIEHPPVIRARTAETSQGQLPRKTGLQSIEQHYTLNIRTTPLQPPPSPQNVIDLTIDSTDSEGSDPEAPTSATKPRTRHKPPPKALPQLGAPRNPSPIEFQWESNDEAIMTLDEPRNVRKPVPNGCDKGKGKGYMTPANTRILREPLTLQRGNEDSDNDSIQVPNLFSTNSIVPGAPTGRRKGNKAPKLTKKAILAAEQARREAYAQEIFNELNVSVFHGGIPPETTLRWSNRLLSTAGKARWHRSKDGVHTTEIELATKVLDCDERIRNTLSHEMCHLACWIISKEIHEAHGKLFKSWAAKVMQKRPDIEVTTTHSYEISYPFEWECEQCAKVYGRFSKSIRPDECYCGACKTGTLKPLFTERTRTPRTQPESRLAATSMRVNDQDEMPAKTNAEPTAPFPAPAGGDLESEVERLIRELEAVSV